MLLFLLSLDHDLSRSRYLEILTPVSDRYNLFSVLNVMLYMSICQLIGMSCSYNITGSYFIALYRFTQDLMFNVVMKHDMMAGNIPKIFD